jgi:hypothetical protein
VALPNGLVGKEVNDPPRQQHLLEYPASVVHRRMVHLADAEELPIGTNRDSLDHRHMRVVSYFREQFNLTVVSRLDWGIKGAQSCIAVLGGERTNGAEGLMEDGRHLGCLAPSVCIVVLDNT